MNLQKKKDLAVRSLNVGRSRIIFNTSRLEEIKEAITKQDVRDLLQAEAISVKEVKGRKKITKRKTRRRAGSIRKVPNTRKQDYVKLTRKLRRHLSNLKARGEITQETFIQLRKEIRASSLKSLSQLKEKLAKGETIK
jgi:large subunit ribosomal protein L19e